MDTRKLQKVDLNLLVALQVLLEERSVSRAAQRLFITQPAMSKTLSRLRDTLADPLFTRSSHGMIPTPRTMELAAELDQLLRGLRHLVAAQHFDPALWEGELTLALSDFIGVGLLPSLMRRLQKEAPGLRLQTVTRAEQQLEKLAGGELDFAVHMEYTHYGADFITHRIGAGSPVIRAREHHPLASEAINWERLRDFPIARIYVSDQEELAITRQTANRLDPGSTPEVSFETSHLLTALEVLRQTDYLMLGPPLLFRNAAAARGIIELPIPEDTNFEVVYMLVRHVRTDDSPVHQWFWKTLLDVIAELN